MIDMTKTIEAKSDQLNADDLIGGSKTITITKVSLAGADQPVVINYENDEGKPYKPCKGMRRAMVRAWGKNGEDYVGRAMTLYNNPAVTWAGSAVGGIQISHMSDIPKKVQFSLSMNRKKKVLYTIEPLTVEQAAHTPLTAADEKNWQGLFDGCETMAQLSEVGASIKAKNYDDAANAKLKVAYTAASERIRGGE